MVAIYLYQMGLTQNEIAYLLETTQPAVSNYIRGKRGQIQYKDLEEKSEIIKEMAERMAKENKKLNEILCEYCPKLVG